MWWGTTQIHTEPPAPPHTIPSPPVSGLAGDASDDDPVRVTHSPQGQLLAPCAALGHGLRGGEGIRKNRWPFSNGQTLSQPDLEV